MSRLQKHIGKTILCRKLASQLSSLASVKNRCGKELALHRLRSTSVPIVQCSEVSMVFRIIAVLIFGAICYGISAEDGETRIAMLLLPVTAFAAMALLSIND